MKSLLIALLIAPFLCSCASEAPQRTRAEPVVESSEPATQPVDEPAPGRALRTVPLEGIEDSDLIEVASLTVDETPITFYSGRWDATSNFAAVAIADRQPFWLDLYTDAERADGASPQSGWGWVDVKLAPDRETLVGVLGWFVESSGPALHVVMSTDAGHTWAAVGELEKPHYMAEFQSLTLADDAWQITVRLDDCGGCGVEPGTTVYRSGDRGRTWTRDDR